MAHNAAKPPRLSPPAAKLRLRLDGHMNGRSVFGKISGVSPEPSEYGADLRSIYRRG